MICGTSNLWDRSYIPNKDLDMSIVLKGNKVKETEDEIINLYSNKEENDETHISKLDSSKLLKIDYKPIINYNYKTFIFIILFISAVSIILTILFNTLPFKTNLLILSIIVSIIFVVIYYLKIGIM